VDVLLELRADLVRAREESAKTSADSDVGSEVGSEAGAESGPEAWCRPSTSVGFLQAALLKVLMTAGYPERDRWIEAYQAIRSNEDAAIFMTEAQLAITHGVDVKRFPDARPGVRRPGVKRKKSARRR
jgi:hypothetical protein